MEAYDKYTLESENSRKKRIDQARRRKQKDAKEAEAASQELEEGKKSKKGNKKVKSDGDMSGLAALIQQRQQSRGDNFLDNLEAKYAPQGKKSGKGMPDEPSEEAFAANRRKATNGHGTNDARKDKRAKK